MPEKENKRNTKRQKAKETPLDREARMKKRAEERAIAERAKKIEAIRKAKEAKKAAEERKERMARRREAQRKANEAKIEKEKQKKAAIRKAETDKAIAGKDLIDFAVTSREYQTQLTRKYQMRKFWEDPNPYEVQSYIPGTIISVDVKQSEIVEEGQQLLILEAMKMQNRIDMPFTARIKKINVKPGEKIPKDFVMVELEAVEE